MEIRDIIHGSIRILPHERAVIDSIYFQRLRQIKQLGFAENSFPSASHNRYIHSLGAMHTAQCALDAIERSQVIPPKARERFRAVVRLAALLHDVGHGPLSHTTEFAMPDVRALGVPGQTRARKATHEDYTLKIILDSPLTPALEAAGAPLGFQPAHVAALIDPARTIEDDFFFERTPDGEKVDFRPLLQQLISSELDADRMDYLRRDSLHAGVSYGQFDFDWLVGNLTAHIKGGRAYLALSHRALYTFEDFLLSRFHMFLMVYFHYKSVVFDEMLGQYFATAPGEYQIPADIEAYARYNDGHLASALSESANPWARRITERKPFRMLVELHSGIPATKTGMLEQQRLLARVERELAAQKIFSLTATSTGELSKYFRKPGDPIFVKYDNHYSTPSFIRLEQCTDLFEKYSEKRSITRVYISPDDYRKIRSRGRDVAIDFDAL